MSTIKKEVVLFVDMMSQPSRAVVWFCKLAKIPHQIKLVQIAKGEHLSEAHRKRNPFGKVPVIDDNGIFVFESHTILRHLARRYLPDDSHWYPWGKSSVSSKDAEQKQRMNLLRRLTIEEYLDWHHTNTRSCARLTFAKYIGPMRGVQVHSEVIKAAALEVEKALDEFDARWLGPSSSSHSGPFIAGDEVSIADLSAACEISQLKLLHYDFSSRKNLYAWFRVMESMLFYDDVHSILNRVIAKL